MNCSNCFQTGPHESSVGESGSQYSILKNYYNNSNNQPLSCCPVWNAEVYHIPNGQDIILPSSWPQPPPPGAQLPVDAADYFQNYTVRDGRPTPGYSNQFASYPLPLGCKVNMNFTNLNPWTSDDVTAKLKRLRLNLNLKEEQIKKLVHCLNCNYVYKYGDKVDMIVAYLHRQL